jgi:hypothetical protein
MAFYRIDRRGWQAFCDTFSHALVGKRAEIEVASLDLGDQIVAEWLPLRGISYDRKDDVVVIALDGVDHMIRSPREFHADYVVDDEDRRQIIRFADPLALPAPADPHRPTATA